MYSYFHALRFTISIEDNNNNTKCMSNRRLDFQNSPSSDFVARGRPLRGQTRLAPLTKRSTCSKSTRRQKPPSEARLMLERKHRVSTKVKAMRSYWIRPLFTLTKTVISARFPRRSEAAPCRSRKWTVTYRISSVPHFGAMWTGIRTVTEVNE